MRASRRPYDATASPQSAIPSRNRCGSPLRRRDACHYATTCSRSSTFPTCAPWGRCGPKRRRSGWARDPCRRSCTVASSRFRGWCAGACCRPCCRSRASSISSRTMSRGASIAAACSSKSKASTQPVSRPNPRGICSPRVTTVPSFHRWRSRRSSARRSMASRPCPVHVRRCAISSSRTMRGCSSVEPSTPASATTRRKARRCIAACPGRAGTRCPPEIRANA